MERRFSWPARKYRQDLNGKNKQKKVSKEEKLVISLEGAVRLSLAGRERRAAGGGKVHGHPTDRRDSLSD